jgi:hypothetical protein
MQKGGKMHEEIMQLTIGEITEKYADLNPITDSSRLQVAILKSPKWLGYFEGSDIFMQFDIFGNMGMFAERRRYGRFWIDEWLRCKLMSLRRGNPAIETDVFVTRGIIDVISQRRDWRDYVKKYESYLELIASFGGISGSGGSADGGRGS